MVSTKKINILFKDKVISTRVSKILHLMFIATNITILIVALWIMFSEIRVNNNGMQISLKLQYSSLFIMSHTYLASPTVFVSFIYNIVVIVLSFILVVIHIIAIFKTNKNKINYFFILLVSLIIIGFTIYMLYDAYYWKNNIPFDRLTTLLYKLQDTL